MSTDQGTGQLPASRSPAPFPRILCAVDGSRSADDAIHQALTLAGNDAELTFLTVCDSRGFGPTRMASVGPHSADAALQKARAAARETGTDARTLLRHSDVPRRAIFEEGRGHDVLVLGAHGRHRAAGFLLGSTALMALHRAPVPVLIARPVPKGVTFPRDILLATDGSTAMRPTITITARLARRHDARVVLVHVDHADRAIRHELAEQTAILTDAAGREPVVVALDGNPPSRIAELALELPASLVVTGSRMVTGVRALGSVSERTGAIAPCSVLVNRGIG